MGVRLFKKFLPALVDSFQEPGPDHSGTDHSCPVDAHRDISQMALSGKTPMDLAMGRRPRDLMDPASMNPEQLTSTPTKQHLLNEESQKSAMRTHLKVQQRQDIRRDLAEWLKVEIIAINGPHGSH